MKCGIDIFEDLKNEKLEYVVWKNTNLIDKFFNGEENLDIFIHKDHHQQFKFLLKKNNWIEVKSTSNNFNDIKHYLFFDHNKILHIHAYYKLFTGNSVSKNYDLSTFTNFFQNKHFDEKYKIWILNYDIQLLLFEIRVATKKKSILGRYLISREIKNYNQEISNILKNIDPKNKHKNFDPQKIDFNSLYFNKKRNQSEIKLLNSVKSFKRVNSLKTFIDEIFFLKRIFFQRLFRLNKFKLKKKYILFLSGPDSSGKTTITNDLERLFKNYLKTKTFSIGKPYPKFLIKILIKKKFLNKNNKSVNYSKNNTETTFLKLLKNINLAIFRYIYSINIFYLNQNSSIIILDRYLSENIGDINGPRSIVTSKNSQIKKILSSIEIFFYKKTKFINHEYKILSSLDECLIRNKKRYKEVEKDDDEIIERFKNYNKSIFKSKKIFKIDNNSEKKVALLNMLSILSKNINEIS